MADDVAPPGEAVGRLDDAVMTVLKRPGQGADGGVIPSGSPLKARRSWCGWG